MNKPQRGFIFLMTLIITAVISLLVLTSMHHILIYHKAINGQKRIHQNFYQLEKIVMQLLEKPSYASGSCVIHQDSANQVVHHLIHNEGCSFKKGEETYQYLVEDLGEFPCLIYFKNGHKFATAHHRVSLVRMEDNYPVSLLQIRYIKVGSILKCLTQEHPTNLGISSWRYLASIDPELFG